MNEHWCMTEWWAKALYVVSMLLVAKTIIFGARWPWQKSQGVSGEQG